jgi:hypothetical protein
MHGDGVRPFMNSIEGKAYQAVVNIGVPVSRAQATIGQNKAVLPSTMWLHISSKWPVQGKPANERGRDWLDGREVTWYVFKHKSCPAGHTNLQCPLTKETQEGLKIVEPGSFLDSYRQI